MNQSELDNILEFAKAHCLMASPFQEVYDLWIKDQLDSYEDFLADLYLQSANEADSPIELAV